LEQAILAEDWEMVVLLLPKEAEPNLPAPLRLVKAHACLAMNRNDESLRLFVSTTSKEDLKKWDEWTTDLRNSHPDNPISGYLRGDALARLQRPSEAAEIFSASLKTSPNHALLLNARGVAYCGIRQFEKALEDITKATAIAPSFVDAHLSLGSLWIQWGNGPEGALEAFNKVLAMSPDCALAVNGKGCALSVTGHLKEGLADLKSANQACPWFSLPLANMLTLATREDQFLKPIAIGQSTLKPGMSIRASVEMIGASGSQEARANYVKAQQNESLAGLMAGVGEQLLLVDQRHPNYGWERFSVQATQGLRIGTDRSGYNPQILITGQHGDILIRDDMRETHGQKPHINISIGSRNIHTDSGGIEIKISDTTTVRVGEGKIVIEVNREKVKEYDCPEANIAEEVVIERKPNGTTTVTVGGILVGEVEEKEGTTTVKVGNKVIEIPCGPMDEEPGDGDEEGPSTFRDSVGPVTVIGGGSGAWAPIMLWEDPFDTNLRTASAFGEQGSGKSSRRRNRSGGVASAPFTLVDWPFNRIICLTLPSVEQGSRESGRPVIVIGGGAWPPIIIELADPKDNILTATAAEQQTKAQQYLAVAGRELMRKYQEEARFWNDYKNDLVAAYPEAARMTSVRGITGEGLLRGYTDQGNWLTTQFGLAYPMMKSGTTFTGKENKK
jgi:tetratricopeptide (TPR) repeat protein